MPLSTLEKIVISLLYIGLVVGIFKMFSDATPSTSSESSSNNVGRVNHNIENQQPKKRDDLLRTSRAAKRAKVQRASVIIKEILSDAASTDDNRDARARRNKHIRKFRDTLEEKRKDFTDTMLAKDHYKALVNSATGSRFYWTLSRHDYVNAVLNTLKGKTDRKQVVLDALNTPLVSSMLKVQASTWSDEGEKHLNSIAEFVEEFVGSVVGSALDGEITAAQQVMETLLRPKLRDGRREALLMLQKITQPWRDGMTMTANDHYFGVSFKKYRAESMRGGGEGESYQDLDPYDCDVDSLTRRLSRRLVEKKDRESCEEAIDCMRAHCKVAQKVFLDNINLLCVEICLIRPIGNLLTDEDIQQIAAAELEDPAGTDALVSER